MKATAKMAEIDTEKLLKRVCEGDSYAFELLLERYRAVVDNGARFAAKELEASSLTADYSLDDLTQEARMALYRAAVSYDAKGFADSVTFGLYAKICIRNAMISSVRRAAAKRRRRESAALKDFLASYGTRAQEAPDTAASDEPEEAVRELLSDARAESLSRYERDVLLLYLQGKSNSEIARSVGRDTKSVSNAIYRIKVKLRGLSK